MTARIISANSLDAVSISMEILKTGGLIAFPTDTVYGLGCLVNLPGSINRLFEVKGRDTSKAIAVLIGDVDHLSQVSAGMSETAGRLAAQFWPGALTLVVPRNPQLTANLSPLPTIGVRMPNHPFALDLLRQAGPLATTSANLSGLPSPVTAQAVLDQLGDCVDLVIDGGPCPGGVPSTVIDCVNADPRILREGAISRRMLQSILGEDF